MTPQALSLEGIPLTCTPQRPFVARFGYLGTCVLPAEVLDNTALPDPGTRLIPPTLRQRCSFQGLCFAHVLHSFAEGLYWADVAATPDLAAAERVLLIEAHLTYALAWDERLYWRAPALIRRLMQTHACNLEPLGPHAEPESHADLLSSLEGPLTLVATVEGSTTDELHDSHYDEGSNHPPKALRRPDASRCLRGHPAVCLACVPVVRFEEEGQAAFSGFEPGESRRPGVLPRVRYETQGCSRKGTIMIQKRPTQVIITTPRGRVVVARGLFDHLEGKMRPDDLGLLRDSDFWIQLSELITGIQITTPAPQRREPA